MNALSLSTRLGTELHGGSGPRVGGLLNAPAREALGHLARETPASSRRHVLDLDDFSCEEIARVLDVAVEMKQRLVGRAERLSALGGELVANVFYEPSTRTRVSFELAAKALGADVINFNASASSVEKGETLLDTVRTLQAMGVSTLVMRHREAGAPYLVASRLGVRVVNAGDGCHAHPTQALLDLFTIRGRFGRLAGLRVAIVGDILHSRVARSNLWGLSKVGAEVVVCGPPTLLPASPMQDRLFPWNVRLEHRLEAALEGADVVIALRLQRERQEAGLLPSVREYTTHYGITPERLRLAQPDALLMHPGPVNEGVEISADATHGPLSAIDEQVSNGVAVRMGLLYLLCADSTSAASGASR